MANLTGQGTLGRERKEEHTEGQRERKVLSEGEVTGKLRRGSLESETKGLSLETWVGRVLGKIRGFGHPCVYTGRKLKTSFTSMERSFTFLLNQRLQRNSPK